MNKIAILLIRFYQKIISGLFGSNKCRFYPTCSSYALSAYQKYNFLKATSLALARILRCHPFCEGGYDPLQ